MRLQIELKRFLESVYGLKVEAVHTVNYEGKRKRRKQGFFRESDYKKVSSQSQRIIPPQASTYWDITLEPWPYSATESCRCKMQAITCWRRLMWMDECV